MNSFKRDFFYVNFKTNDIKSRSNKQCLTVFYT